MTVLTVMGETEAHFCLVLIMAESIPSGGGGGVGAFVGHLSFCFGKAANAPRSGQMFIEKPTVGLKDRVQIPKIPGQHQNCIFQLQIPYLWEICNILIKLTLCQSLLAARLLQKRSL